MQAQERRAARKQARLRKQWKKGTIAHAALAVGTALALLVGGVGFGLGIVFLGPWQTASDLAALAMLESSALKFLPRLYLGAEGMAAVSARNTIAEIEAEVDTGLIDASAAQAQEGEEDYQDIEIVPIKGSTYKGFMMIVKDPARVIVGVSSDKFSNDRPGKALSQIVEHYGGVGGTNASGFWDDKGQGNGGMPIGLVISQGKLLNNAYDNASYNTVIGFDENNVLVIQKMGTTAAMKKGLRDAVAFGPGLIINGVSASITGTSGGVNPRTAIGQRADGAVLMLVIDGRQPNSVGATYANLIEIMEEFGAVNAANLDGGSSATMWYMGEQLNDGVVITGEREIPTAFVVLAKEEDAP